MSKLDEISKEFSYQQKVDKNWGKFWHERYSENEELYGNVVNSRNRKVLNELPMGENLLDVGSGFGDMLYFLKDKYQMVYGIDPSENMVRASEFNLRSKAVSNFKVEQGIVQNLPFQNDFFDSILLLDVFEHIWPEDLDASLREIYRVLRPKGYFILVTPSKRSINLWTAFDNFFTGFFLGKKHVMVSKTDGSFTECFYSKREVVKYLSKNGFKVLKFSKVSFYPAPERQGLLGHYISRIRKRRKMYNFLKRIFSVIESIRIFNQKMFFIITK